MSNEPPTSVMLDALVDTAIEDALANGTTINHVNAFKAKVRERLEDNERSHTGYIAIAYRQLEKRRARSVETVPGAYKEFEGILDHDPLTPEQHQAVLDRNAQTIAEQPSRRAEWAAILAAKRAKEQNA